MILKFKFIQAISLKALLVGLLTCLQLAAVAQQLVSLENGSRIKGLAKINDEKGVVEVTTADGSLWVFDTTEVLAVDIMEATSQSPEIRINPSGYYNITDLGLLFGNNGNFSTITVSAQTVSGYRFNKHWSVGLGLGIESFDIPLAPVFLEGRYHLLEGRFSPYATFQAGYGIPIENYLGIDGKRVNRGGYMINSMLGIRHQFSNTMGLVLSAGYRYQQSVSKQTYWWFNEGDSAEIRTTYNRLVVRFGFLFN